MKIDKIELYWITKLDKIYPSLRKEADSYYIRRYKRNKLPYTTNVHKKIYYYFEELLRDHNIAKTNKNFRKIYKEFYYNKYVIKEENIPEEYYITREKRNTQSQKNPETIKEMNEHIINDQKHTISKYIDFFLDEYDSKLNNGKYQIYEMNWAFQGLKNLGTYDNATMTFKKRKKNTIYTFPPINKDVLEETINIAEDYIKHKVDPSYPLKIEELKEAYNELNFKKIYEYALKQDRLKHNYNEKNGKWIKYEKGSDYQKLKQDLDNSYTGWCTADSDFQAYSLLYSDDFYVYYTLDENNQYKIPRIAIRERNNEVLEVRGILQNQNIEPELINIVKEKLKQFNPSKKYDKIINDTIKLNKIEEKIKNNIELNIKDLVFLYDIKEVTQTFGTKSDERKEKIRKQRNNIKDLKTIFDVDEQEISTDPKNIKKIYYGDLLLTDIDKMPDIVVGNLIIDTKKAKYINMPKMVTQSVKIKSLKSTRNIIFPEKVGDSIEAKDLMSANNIILPKGKVNNINLSNLLVCDKITFPDEANNIDLRNITLLENINFPEKVYGQINLNSISKMKNVKLPNYMKEKLNTPNLLITENIYIPESIKDKVENPKHKTI